MSQSTTPDSGGSEGASPRLYVYKLTVDDGGAPCITDDLLTLGICKPAIRSTAEPDAIIFGIGSNALPLNNRLVYVAVVTRKECEGQYFEVPHYADRLDCIYERDGAGRFRRRPNACFHADPRNMERDLGPAPGYPRANVLVSSDFRYFGNTGTNAYKQRFPHLKELAETLRQGHRINHPEELRTELLQLKNELWADGLPLMRRGTPCQPPRVVRTADEDDCCIEICSPRRLCLPDDDCAPCG